MKIYTSVPTWALLLTALQASTMLSTTWANPVGGVVTSGAASMATAGNILTVNQTTQNAIINWQGFSVGNGETTQFVQPSAASAVLNRVVGGNPTEIYGTLKANGNVYLINQNGILVGSGGVINTNSFVGSTLDVPDAEFLAGGNLTFSGNSAAVVKNLGSIQAIGGDVALIGRQVVNAGTLKADNGTVAMAAGSRVVLKPAGAERVTVLAGESTDSLAHSGIIEAANAELKANGGNAYAVAVNTGGIIRATGAHEEDGRVILDGGDGNVAMEGTVEATKANGDGGAVTVTGKQVWLAAESSVKADGANGGTIKVYGEDTAQSYGKLSARGTAGNGGFIETSGGLLDLGTNVPDVAGTVAGGTWLIDPYNISIVAGSGNTNIPGTSPFTSTGTASLGVGLITTALSSGNVTIATGAGGAAAGDIVLSTDLDFNGTGSGHTLAITAHRNITLNGKIYDSSTGDGDALGLVLTTAQGGTGAIVANKDIVTGGGSINFAGDTYIAGSGAMSFNAGSGNVLFGGQTILANTAGLTIDAHDVTFNGKLDSGNLYAYDATLRTWSNALTGVKSGTGANAGDTYLATATSALENAIVNSASGGNQAWLGGSDEASEGAWRWVAGPEGLQNGGVGVQFWQGTGSGYAVGGQYSNWNGGEPNNSGASENALQMGAGTAGQWNDLPTTGSNLGSIVETNLAPSAMTLNIGAGGTATFNGTVGATKALGNLTINGASGATSVNADITSDGVVNFGNAITWGVTGKTLTANSIIQQAALTANVANMTWVADKMDIQSTFTNSNANGVLALRQRTNGTQINVGAVGDGTANTLELSAAELGRLSVPNVRIGDSNAGNMVLSDDIALTNITNLTLATGGTLDDGVGNTVQVAGLALASGGTLSFNNGHDVDRLALANTAANSTFVDVDGFTIGNVDARNGIAASGRLVELTAGGAVDQTQAITTAGLNLLGSNADWTLTHASNNIDTLAGNTKSVNYLDSNALALGSVNSTVGLTTSGKTQARTASGNLSVWSPVQAGGGGNSLVLASAANFENHLDGTALNAGMGGRYLIYSTSPLLDILAGLTGNRRYNSTFAGYGPSSVAGSGNMLLYSLNPVLTFTPGNVTTQYGNSAALTYTVSGYVTGDSAATAFTGAPTLAVGGGGAVGNQTITAGLGTLTNPQNYTFAYGTGTATITPAPLTITANNVTRQFAENNPTLTATYTGLTNGDTVDDITGLTLATTATNASPIGTYTITAAGATNGNYTITLHNGTLTVIKLAEAEAALAQQSTYATKSAPQQGSAPTPLNSSVPALVVPQIGVLVTDAHSTSYQTAYADTMAHYSTLDDIAQGSRGAGSGGAPSGVGAGTSANNHNDTLDGETEE